MTAAFSTLEVARFTGISLRKLQRFDESGVVRPRYRKGGQRLRAYSPRQVMLLVLLRELFARVSRGRVVAARAKPAAEYLARVLDRLLDGAEKFILIESPAPGQIPLDSSLNVIERSRVVLVLKKLSGGAMLLPATAAIAAIDPAFAVECRKRSR